MHPEKIFAQFETDLVALRHGVEVLRKAGVQILSAEITTLGDCPVIHVVDHPAVRTLDGCYVHCRIAGSEILAAPLIGTTVQWLSPTPTPGQKTQFTERTVKNG